jgi:FAD/FMN-containing dehydrogenase
MDERHKQLVAALAARVKDFYARGEAFKVYHGSTNSTRVVEFDPDKMVDVSGLNRVLRVDPEKRTALVEPNVPMDRLVEATLPHGLVPPVVMEFPGITVAGGLQGGAGESSSFKWGTFNRTLNWYDMMLADGEVVRASRRKHADLFWGSAGSYGSLGVVTLAEVKLIPARRFVELTYTPVGSFAEAVETIKQLTKQQPDFVDGILFSATSGVIMSGKLADGSSAPTHTFSRARDEWFYLHAQKIARRAAPHTEAIPLQEYLFRYDRGAFWTGKDGFARLKMPFNRVTRWLLDPLLHTRKMYDALQASGVSQEFIIQDLAMPAEQTVPFLQFVDKTFGIYPLWLCPLLPDADSPLLSSALRTDMIINVGVWGHISRSYDEVVHANKKLEAKVRQLGGKKWLYAYAYYSEKQFWELYDKPAYDALRKKYHAATLPSVYEKTHNKKRYPISAKRGIRHALLGQNGIRLQK